jgi:hypothetical protein
MDSLSRQHQGPRAVLNALERVASDYGSEIARTKQNLAIAESQLRDYQASLGKPFDHEAYLANLTALRDQLKISLSGHTEEGAPKAGDLAEQIKALRAASSVDAAPERAAQRHLDAEEPVTTRIRRMTDARHADESDRTNLPAESAPTASPLTSPGTTSEDTAHVWAARPEISDRNRAATGR